jgi:hypothetical protein
MSEKSQTSSFLEVFDAMVPLAAGIVILGPLAPGFLLCIPGLMLAVFLLAVPVVAIALIALAVSIVAMPFMFVGFLFKRWRSRIVVNSRTSVQPIAASLPARLDAPVAPLFNV